MILGVLVVLGALVFIAGTAIQDAGNQDPSESVQKILINYLQVAALARAFPLRWPAALQGLFEFQGAVSTLGDHLVNPDCVAGVSDDEADAAGAAMANAYAAEFEEEDSDYTALGPPKKKAKTRGKLSEEAGKQAWCLVVKLKFGDMSKIMKLKELFEDYVSAHASISLPMLCPVEARFVLSPSRGVGHPFVDRQLHIYHNNHYGIFSIY